MKTESTPAPDSLTVTDAQAQSFAHLCDRFNQIPEMIEGEFMRAETLIVKIGGMFIGIEPDGYAHS